VSNRNILVVQLADIGDLLLAAPAIRHLRDQTGDRITLLTKPSNRALADQLVDELIVADKHLYDRPLGLLNRKALASLVRLIRTIRKRDFDEVVILHHLTTRFGAFKFAVLSFLTAAPVRVGLDNGRGWFLHRKVRDRGFGAANEAEYWTEVAGGTNYVALRGNPESATRLIQAAGCRGTYVVVHPGSGTFSVARRWPPEHFAVLADQLHAELALEIVVVGSQAESRIGDSIVRGRERFAANLCGKTNLDILASVLDGATLYVGNDGGVSQLAQARGVPSITIFGPTSAKTWHTSSPRSRAVHLDLACSPCFYIDRRLGTPQGCATRECLVDLLPARVFEAAESLLRDTLVA
jgi:heptosyltransferase-2